MTRPTAAGRRHRYHDNPTTPGTCWICHRADPHSHNRIHQPSADIAQQQAEHRRRAGEQVSEEGS